MKLPTINLSSITLWVALLLSAVASWYSIVGLAAIFAGAAIPVIIMGIIFDISKVNTTAWLKKYWNRAGIFFKIALISAVLVLSTLTSMGIFGFLSNAHSQQNSNTSEQSAKIAAIDELIAIQRDNISANKEVLKQLDAQLNTLMANTSTEGAAIKGIQLRRQQNSERNIIQKDIDNSNTEIARLSAEKAPIQAQLRKFEAEVGPIKYIASLIYGDNPSPELLERSVRWMIILLVVVFDPLALLLVIAANSSKKWDEEDAAAINESVKTTEELLVTPDEVVPPSPVSDIPTVAVDQVVPVMDEPSVSQEPQVELSLEPLEPPQEVPHSGATSKDDSFVEEPIEQPTTLLVQDEEVSDYITVNGKRVHKRVVESMYPELLADTDIVSSFGSSFPKKAKRDELFVRTDIVPHKVFKFGSRVWVEANKETSPEYLQNSEYIKYLIQLIESEKYDTSMLTQLERDVIKTYLQ